MKLKRPRLILRKGVALAALALPAAGCADTPEEALRAAFDDACATITACGEDEPICATATTRSAFVDELQTDFDESGATQGCKDVVFEAYADLYSCYSNLTCEEFEAESGDCEDRIDQAAIDAACPGIDL